MSILDHARWDKIQPYIKLQAYNREGGQSNPRIRIELMNSTPDHTKRVALNLTMPCVACGNKIHPFRLREAAGNKVFGIYFAPTCALNVNIGCSRGIATRNEYVAVQKAITTKRG